MKINFETVNANDLQPRIASAIQSGSGPDIVMLNNNHPQLYAASCADVSDVAEAIAKAQGASTSSPAPTPTTARNSSRCRGR